jgi:cobalt transporter subunit CbtA
MIKRMLTSALFAGFAAGLLAALLHFAFVQEFILLGEKYETGELTHFENAMPADHAGQHDHTHGAEGHDHGPGAEAPGTFSRNMLTVIFASLVYVSYGLIMVAGFALAQAYGATITEREGLLWGIAGFVSFQLAPALGLAPELPGTIAADLSARQIWWWGTVLSTGTGLALLAYGRGYLVWAVAVIALAAPHVIGAPLPDAYWGAAPPEVAAMFSARVLGVALVVWAFLGWLAGCFWSDSETP